MKLATLNDGSRDGLLAVVSRDLASAHFAVGIASRLQDLLDDWNFISPQLEDLYATLNGGKARHAFAFDPRHCMAPLPRAYRCVVAEVGPDDKPRLVEAAGDDGRGGCDDVMLDAGDDEVQAGDDEAGEDAAQHEAGHEAGHAGGQAAVSEPGLAVVTGEVAARATAGQALDGVRLLLLTHRWRQADGRGGATAYGPVASTLDEAGAAWQRGRLHLPLEALLNQEPPARIEVAAALRWSFGSLVARLARERPVHAGTLVGCPALGPARAALHDGDHIRLEIVGADGHSLCGAIDRRVVATRAR